MKINETNNLHLFPFIDKYTFNSYPQLFEAEYSPFLFLFYNRGDSIQYFGSLQSRELGEVPIYATGVLFLLVRRYHLTRVSVCASQKYFFHIGCKHEMNMN